MSTFRSRCFIRLSSPRAPRGTITSLALLAALAGLIEPAAAQCASALGNGQGFPGTNDVVNATTLWDADGPGPESAKVVLAGTFTAAGDARAHTVAAFDPNLSTWAPIGSGAILNNSSAVTVRNGAPVLGGVAIYHWNGTSWLIISGGSVGCTCLCTLPNGDVVAGGSFTQIGGTAANRIARWNGSTWAPMGAGLDAYPSALVALPNGDVIVGGTFSSAGGNPANRIARWNGTTWTQLGSGTDYAVNALALASNGDVLAGGVFTMAGGIPANRVARWNGSAWSPLGNGFDGPVYSVLETPAGALFAGGAFTASGATAVSRIARWNGSQWLACGVNVGSGVVRTLMPLPNGDLLAAGGFQSMGGLPLTNIARWDGANWHALSGGMNEAVHALARLPNGDLVAGGNFTTAGKVGQYVAANRVARWNGSTWAPLGVGLNGIVYALAAMPNGDVIAGGGFTTSGGTSVSRIARWNGGAWLPMATGVVGAVRALAVLPNGDVVAGGSFTSAGGVAAANIARWNGVAWAPLGLGVNGNVRALLVLANGDLVAGGDFTSAGGIAANFIARYSGGAWSALGSGLAGNPTYVAALAQMANGDLVAGGLFATAGGVHAGSVARWNGANWSSIGPGYGPYGDIVAALTTLPNGNLVAGGTMIALGGVSAYNLSQWNGSTWSQLGTGVGGGGVFAMATVGNGEIEIGGSFTGAGGPALSWNVAASLARITTACPAVSEAYGAGCPSSGGNNELAAIDLPWAGMVFRAEGTGLPAPSFVFAVTSLAPFFAGMPLSAVMPQGVPGCALHMSPDFVQAIVCLAGTAISDFAIPSDPTLVTSNLYHQMVAMEVDGAFSVLSLTSTNGLRLTIGSY